MTMFTSDTVPSPLETLPEDDPDDNAARGCVYGSIFTAVCWLVLFVGLLAFAGIIRFS